MNETKTISQTTEEAVYEVMRYYVGVAQQKFDPSKETHKHMLHLIAYDIRNPRRLRRVAKICEDFGIRVEFSVFECDLNQDDFKQMWQYIADEIDDDEDSVLAYRICGACVQKIKSIGDITRPDKVLFYMP